jgi:hypothetical protein
MTEPDATPSRWMTVQHMLPDLDAALVFVVQQMAEQNFNEFSTITLHPAWTRDPDTGSTAISYQATISGRVDNKSHQPPHHHQ